MKLGPDSTREERAEIDVWIDDWKAHRPQPAEPTRAPARTHAPAEDALPAAPTAAAPAPLVTTAVEETVPQAPQAPDEPVSPAEAPERFETRAPRSRATERRLAARKPTAQPAMPERRAVRIMGREIEINPHRHGTYAWTVWNKEHEQRDIGDTGARDRER